MTITNLLKTLASVFLMLSINAASLVAQSNVKLPEPILPRSEAGKFIPRLEELRVLSEKKQWKEFLEQASRLKYDTALERKSHIRGGDDNLTKDEFAAQEWLFYYVCKMGLPSVKEMWNMDNKTMRFGIAAELIFRMQITSYDKSFGIDDKKFRRIRVAWLASLLKSYRMQRKEIEKEVVAMREILIRNHSIKLLRENKEKYSKGHAIGNWNLHYWDVSQFKSGISEMEAILNFNTQRMTLEWGGEYTFVYLLFTSFPDDIRTINEFIEMAGYAHNYESASFWYNMNKFASEFEEFAPKINNYMRRTGFDKKRFYAIYTEGVKKEEVEKTRHKERVGKMLKPMLEEERKLQVEINEMGKKYRREQEAKERLAKPSSPPPPATAPTDAPAKP